MASAKRLFQLRLQSPLVTPDGALLVGAMGWEIARHAQVGRQAAAATIKNMVRAGDLRVIGRFHPPEMPRPLKVYAPREPAPRNWGNPLNDVMAGWGRPKRDPDSEDSDE